MFHNNNFQHEFKIDVSMSLEVIREIMLRTEKHVKNQVDMSNVRQYLIGSCIQFSKEHFLVENERNADEFRLYSNILYLTLFTDLNDLQLLLYIQKTREEFRSRLHEVLSKVDGKISGAFSEINIALTFISSLTMLNAAVFIIFDSSMYNKLIASIVFGSSMYIYNMANVASFVRSSYNELLKDDIADIEAQPSSPSGAVITTKNSLIPRMATVLKQSIFKKIGIATNPELHHVQVATLSRLPQ